MRICERQIGLDVEDRSSVQQVGTPQELFNHPVNLFVAKFLGTPPINVFRGSVRGGRLYIGEDVLLRVNGVPDQQVFVGIRPEGFVLNDRGAFGCALGRVEVMGRDISVVCTNPLSLNPTIRAIIGTENKVDTESEAVRFALKPGKVFIFHKDTEERIYFA